MLGNKPYDLGLLQAHLVAAAVVVEAVVVDAVVVEAVLVEAEAVVVVEEGVVVEAAAAVRPLCIPGSSSGSRGRNGHFGLFCLNVLQHQ